MLQSTYSKIIIVDFDDSNTYNIASVLFPYEKNIKVVHYSKFFHDDFFCDFINDLSKKAVVLGPGPGHPNFYQMHFQRVLAILQHPKIYCMGICLGHQLILHSLGYSIVNSKNPTHGVPIQINFRGVECSVQRYNSLAVLTCQKVHEELVIDGEVMIAFFPQGVTYQFHPESVATTQQRMFFDELILFINCHTTVGIK